MAPKKVALNSFVLKPSLKKSLKEILVSTDFVTTFRNLRPQICRNDELKDGKIDNGRICHIP